MQNIYVNQEDFDEELNIDFKKILKTLIQRKGLILKIIVFTLLFFILLAIFMPKKYTVTTDLYVNKANNTNMVEVNPFIIENMSMASGGLSSLMSGGNSGLTDEIELIKSQLVLDNVIKENNIKYPTKKKYGIFKNPRAGQYISAAGFIGKGKNPKIDNKKGTNIISITYSAKKPQTAYDIVNSITKNYIDLHKQLHSKKAKSDIELLEREYIKARANLNVKVASRRGLSESMGEIGRAHV